MSQVKIKRLIALTLAFIMIGTALELILLAHYEGPGQLVPLILIGLSFVLFFVLLLYKSGYLQKAFFTLMILSAMSGLLGVYFHFSANMEFASEMRPSASTWSVFLSSFSGAIPALAPGSMMVFALIGYLYGLTHFK